MRNKRSILMVIVFMAVGFAAVSTTLYINGQTKINANQEDFNVYYSDAYVNEVQDKSVITDDTHIIFKTELDTLGETYILDYEVTNGSKNYDADLEMVCTGGNEYLSVSNEFDDISILESMKTRFGKLILEQIKSYSGDNFEVTIECVIDANAVERDSLGLSDRNEISVVAVDENENDLNAKAYQITSDDEETLLNSLAETNFISDVSDVDAIIEVESDYFENIAYTTFDVSSIATEGDIVIILHFDEDNQEWEYICTDVVDENGEVHGDFTSYSPIAFIVIQSDGTENKVEHSHTYVESILNIGTCAIPSLVEYKCSVCSYTYQEEKIIEEHVYEDVYHVHSGNTSSGGTCYQTPNYINVTCTATVFDDDGNGCETCPSCGAVYCDGEDFRRTCGRVLGTSQSGYKLSCSISTSTVEYQKCSVCGEIKQ